MRRVAAGLAVSLVVTLAALILFRASVGWWYRIPTDSMAPTLLNGDMVFVSYRAYANGPPDIGDVIAFEPAHAAGSVVVKRVVGRAGDTVVLEDGAVGPSARVGQLTLGCTRPEALLVRREQLADDVTIEHLVRPGVGNWLRDAEPVVVPEHHVFVLGDNRDRSEDSRRFGPVPLSRVLGRVTRVTWSIDPCTGRMRDDRGGRLGQTRVVREASVEVP